MIVVTYSLFYDYPHLNLFVYFSAEDDRLQCCEKVWLQWIELVFPFLIGLAILRGEESAAVWYNIEFKSDKLADLNKRPFKIRTPYKRINDPTFLW